ncbi:MAG: hypothetical protein WC442_04075 [Candidatus Omnitrophota bacterium]
MKKIFSWQVIFGAVLISLSVIAYYIDYLIFHDARHIFIYLVGDFAFVFLEVFLVTVVLHQLLSHREKKTMLNKLNMVIGAFYSETGLELLRIFSASDENSNAVQNKLIINGNWKIKDFQLARIALKRYDPKVQIKKVRLDTLKDFLSSKRDFMLRLLENPNLLEHESFTNLLWAVFHLTEELAYRKSLEGLFVKDLDHLSTDIKRVYQLLLLEWLEYMKHLKKEYPYLFSLALRVNPFDKNAHIEIS